MDVITAAVRFHQQRVLGEVRQQPEFDLGVVRGQQHMAGLDGKRSANLAAQFGADGNVLQVGIGRRQPSRGRAGLPEGSVQAPGGRTQQRGQGIDVC